METEVKRGEHVLELRPAGRLDTTSAPLLQELLLANLEGVEELIFDMDRLEYVSSAGLRVLLFARRAMDVKGGSMRLIRCRGMITELLELTGIAQLLNVETAEEEPEEKAEA